MYTGFPIGFERTKGGNLAKYSMKYILNTLLSISLQLGPSLALLAHYISLVDFSIVNVRKCCAGGIKF